MNERVTLSLGDHAVLALLAEQPRHGWAIVRELAAGGDIGRVWTLSRPLAYRALDTLCTHALIRATGTEPGDGPRRTVYAVTEAGGRELDRWLATPVEHLREVRTELLVKLVIAERCRIDTRPLLRAQRRELRPIIAGLRKAAAKPGADLVDAWRHESADAVQRFLDGALKSC